MKYIEVKAVNDNREGYYEGRFYIIAEDKYEAVAKVKVFLEITDMSKWQIFTRELSAESYKTKMRNAELQTEEKNNALKFLACYGVDFDGDNVHYDNITKKTAYEKRRSFIERLGNELNRRYPKNDTIRWRDDRLSC